MTRALALLCAAAALVACGETAARLPEQAPDGELWLPKDAIDKGMARLATAAEHQFSQAVVAAGRIAFDDAQVAHVFSPVNGRISRVMARLGQEVKKDAPLAALVSPDVGSAAADLLRSRADLAAGKRELDRQQKLAAAHAGSQRDLEAAESAYEKARAEEARTLQRSRLLRGMGGGVTQEFVLRSPIAGHLIARNVSAGGEVQGQYSGGAAVELFTVGNVDRVWAIADVSETDLPQVAMGAEVTVAVVAWPGKVWKGRVEWISRSLDPALRTAKVRCSLDNARGELRPEMYATLAIARPERRLLAVPARAVAQANELAFVQVATGRTSADGRPIFRRQRVQVAEDHSWRPGGRAAHQREMQLKPAELEELVPIADGLKAGEQVLVETQAVREASNEEAAVTDKQLAAAGITVQVAEKRALPDSLLAGAHLSFDDLAVAHVLSPVTGRVLKVLVTPGQHVARGAALAVVSSPDLAAAEADLSKARAELSAAQRELNRQRELAEAGAAARRDLELADDRHKSAVAEEKRADLRARLLRQGNGDAASGEYVVRSPLEGEVVSRSVSPGMEVQGQYSGGGAAVELFTVGSARKLWVLADVFEMDLPRIALGEHLDIEAQGRSYQGRIDWISDALDPTTRTARVRCVIDNADGHLRPETYSPVRISVGAQPILAVPRDSLLRLGDETVLFVAESGKDKDGRSVFKRRRVLAREGDPTGLVPVFAGLEAGERVVTRGAIFLAGAL